MKPAALGVSSRRRWLKAAVLGLAPLAFGCAGSDGVRSQVRHPLQRVGGIVGGRLVSQTDAGGAPVPGGIGPIVSFVFPVAVAASSTDVFVADAGAGRIFRYDRALETITPLPGMGAGAGTRLQAGPDGSIYVLDAVAGEIRRYSRVGMPLPSLLPRIPTSRYSDFAIDPLTAMAYAVDFTNRAIDEIHPLGRVAQQKMRVEPPGPLASNGRSLFIGDFRCGCVVEWQNGRPVRSYGAGKLRQPKAIAVDGSHVYALDAFDRSVSLIFDGGAETMTPNDLGLLAPESLAAFSGLLYVADGAGRSIGIYSTRGRR